MDIDASVEIIESESSPQLEIKLFGPMEVHMGGLEMPSPATRKSFWLLALLCLRAGTSLDRDRIATMLWPDSDDNSALKNLRQCLFHLRQALGHEAWRVSSEAGNRLRFDFNGAQVDVVDFRRHVGRGDVDAMRAAHAIYRGALLEGVSEAWVVDERGILERDHIAAMDSLIKDAISRCNHSEAITYIRSALRVDPFQEPLQRQLMEALRDSGDTSGALYAYRSFATLLDREMRIAPDEETTELYRRIRRGVEEKAVSPSPKPSQVVPKGSEKRSILLCRVPVPLTPLIGREGTLADIRSHLAVSRLVSLVGAGGMGKTRLAIQVASDLSIEFADGSHFVDLSSLENESAIPDWILDSLRLPVRDARTSAMDLLKNRLAPANLLLILDNCEQLEGQIGTVAEALLRECPNLSILATSRQPLGVSGEFVWRISSLQVPPERPNEDVGSHRTVVLRSSSAVQLFEARVRDVAGDWSPCESELEVIGEICRRLDGIPLAIELAAARMRSLSTSQIAERLSDRFHLLTRGSRAAPNRHQTLEAAIDWSYNLLDEAERTLFRRLSVFAGGWTLEAAHAVCGSAESDESCRETVDLLDRLVEKSLVILERSGANSRYSFLETIRQYAWERLGESSQKEEIERRHAEHHVSFCEQARAKLHGPETAEWLDRLDAEYENIRRALTWLLLDSGGGEAALRLSTSLAGYFLFRGRWNEGREVYSAVLAHGGSQHATLLRAQALNCAGLLSMQQIECESAEKLFTESVAISQELGERRHLAGPLHNLGEVATLRGDFDKAQVYFEEAFAINRETGNLPWQAHNLKGLGNLAGDHVGDFEAARGYWDQSVSLFRELGNDDGVTHVLMLSGVSDLRLGQVAAARAKLDEALALGRNSGNRGLVAHVLANLATLLCLTEQYDQVRDCLNECFQLCRESRDPRVEALGVETMARLHLKTGRPERAAQLWGSAQAMREQIGSPLPTVDVVQNNEVLDNLRAALGDEAVERELAAGRAVNLADAIQLAVSE